MVALATALACASGVNARSFAAPANDNFANASFAGAASPFALALDAAISPTASATSSVPLRNPTRSL